LEKTTVKFSTPRPISAFSYYLKNPDDNLLVDFVNQSLIVQCFDFCATHLFSLALSPVALFTLNLLKKHGVKTAHWFYEDFRRAAYWKDVLSGYDCFFAIQKGPLRDVCVENNVRFSFLPTAVANDVINMPLSMENLRLVDITFVGLPSSYRIGVLEFLAHNGCSLAIAGSGWQEYRGPLEKSIISGNWVDGRLAYQTLQTAKIGINLSLYQPDADRANTHLSPRVFDALASGCVLLTEEAPLAKETLGDLHFHIFASKEAALEKIQAILADYENEKTLCEQNRHQVIRQHTYANRVKEIVAFCGDRAE
jgi:spore maturation protein CgeB